MKVLIITGFVLLCYSCNTREQGDIPPSSTDSESQTTTIRDTIYLVRNADITPANSYSDLFLDSSMIDQFIQSNNLSGDDDKRLRSFYNYRNYQFAWFSSQGFTEQAKGFWNLHDKMGSKADKSLQLKMDTLLNQDTTMISRFDTSILRTELALTRAYLNFYTANRDKTQFANVSPEKAIPVRKLPALVLADSILSQYADSATHKLSPQYLALKQRLQLLVNLAKDSSSGPLLTASAKQFKKGSSSAAISQLKKRLQKAGYLQGTDTTALYNDSLFAAIQKMQSGFGLRSTGTINDSLINILSMPAEKQVQQIIINLYRMQWMPVQQESNYLSVNIPSFLLKVYENNTMIFEMPVAVGKEGTNTTMFTGNMDQLVFSPYWNVPASIVKNEILPKMKADKNYLKSKNMEIVGNNDTLPKIRQLPGKDNAMGKVKFLFPNRYDIYFHDTYAKEVFNKANRAISHGCIRLADAEKLAVYLLRNNNDWTAEKVKTAMNTGKEQFVKLSPAMPVVITYYTAWVDENGQLVFRNDIYGNDKKTAQMMFENAMPVSKAVSSDTLSRRP